jgi:hypothetical protein
MLKENNFSLGYSTQQNYHSKKILQGILHTEDENMQIHEHRGSIKLHEKKRQVIRE